MLEVQTKQKLDQVESGLRMSAQLHGGKVLAAAPVGHLVRGEEGLGDADAITFTLCFSGLFAPLLRADIRFAAFLPSRISVCVKGGAVFLEAVSPRECCHLIGRPDMEPLGAALEDTMRLVMQEAAHRPSHAPTEELINMRAALPQRIDCHGSKVEELAGTGEHDAKGG